MLGLLFGWRKASKCKKLVKLLHCRIQLVKSKKYVIIKQLRDDISQLLKNSQFERAFSLAEQLFKDQSLFDAYDLLGTYCEFITIRFRFIRRHRNCPEDINEAISTLIFATAWCGDLPELQVIRKLFNERYGHKFTKIAAELHIGNFVNHEIKEKLCVKSIPDDAKMKLMIDIAKESIFTPWQLGCDHSTKVQLLQVYGNNKDDHLEGFIFKEETYVRFNATSSCCERTQSVRPFVSSEPEKRIRSSLSRDNTCLEEVKELEYIEFQDEHYNEDKRVFLFNSGIHPLTSKDLSNGLEYSCKEAENAGNSIVVYREDQKSASTSHNHVHPKLPDCDELAMKFKALKKQHLQRKNLYKLQSLYFLENDSFF
ncbi:uncharacterized protein LOC126665642 [Mercurialis annua]|uniref:uncharacterized protein LOC126665642 n=1 Tax=Mercurialis annua TaxID=3986 RepID=UPI00215DFB4F|nr:uncharacterized protein LOC126665642 [Mercurialis annua]